MEDHPFWFRFSWLMLTVLLRRIWTHEEKNRLKAEARCLMVDAFFNTFQHFGGIPIMDHALETGEVSWRVPS